MKLQHLTESKLDKSKFPDVFSDELVDAVERLVEELATIGVKVVDYPSSSGPDIHAKVNLSSGIFDVNIELTASANRKIGYNVEVVIPPRYLATGQSYFKNEVTSYFDLGKEEVNVIGALDHLGPPLIDLLEQLTEWYMDVSGEYGKVKIYADWRGDRKVSAIAGDFDVKENQGKVY